MISEKEFQEMSDAEDELIFWDTVEKATRDELIILIKELNNKIVTEIKLAEHRGFIRGQEVLVEEFAKCLGKNRQIKKGP